MARSLCRKTVSSGSPMGITARQAARHPRTLATLTACQTAVDEPPDPAPPPSGRSLGPRPHWYVALPASRLAREPVAVRVGGEELTLVRAADGTPLAAGGGPPLAEHGHYVWAWLGEGAPTVPPRAAEPLARAGYAFEQRTIRVRANWRLVLENSLDFSHSAFVHPFTQPTWLIHRLGGSNVMTATYRPTPGGLAVEGRLGRLRAYEHHFDLPDRLRLVILPGTPFTVDLVVHHVPEDARTTRMEVLLGRRAWPFEARGPSFKPGDLLIHRQDVAIVEAQQAALDAGPPPREFHCAADAYTLLMRRVLDAAEAGGWRPPDIAPRAVEMRV